MPTCNQCQTDYYGTRCPKCQKARQVYVFQVMWNWYQEVRARLRQLVRDGEPATDNDLQAVEDLKQWAADEGVGSVPVGFQEFAQLLEAAERERTEREEREERERQARERYYR